MGWGVLDKFGKLEKQANLQVFLDKEKINIKSREQRKLEAKKDKTAEDDKKIRQIQRETEQIAQHEQQCQQVKTRAGLGERILKGYFAYKLVSLLCHTFADSSRSGHTHGNMAPQIFRRTDEDHEVENNEIDIPQARAEQIEQVRDQFDKINEEGKALGISQDDTFSQDDKDKLTELAAISRDTENPLQAELYADKCQDLGLDRNEALQIFQQELQINDTKEQGEEKTQDLEEIRERDDSSRSR